MGNYLNNRLKFHTASRVAIETNQPLAAAMNVDGHVVTDTQVWTSPYSAFPVNSAAWNKSTDVVKTTQNLISVFTNDRTVSDTITKTALGDGFVWRNTAYPAVELYDAISMQPVQFSDGPESAGKPQAYEIVGSNGLRVTEWVPPTAVIDPATGSPVAGYSGIAEAYDGSAWTILQQSAKGSYAWALAKGNWEFVFKSGMLTFDPAYTPTGTTMGYKSVRFTGFKYIGDTLDKTIKEISAGSSVTPGSSIAVQPFKFSLATMDITSNKDSDGSLLSIQTYSLKVPGFVFNLVNDATGMVMGDIEYTADGGSNIIFVDLDAADLGDNTAFTAFVFVNKDGSNVEVLPAQSIVK